MGTLLNAYTRDSTPFADSGFRAGKMRWSAKYLYDQVKAQKLKPERVNLRHLSLSHLPWQGGEIKSLDHFLFHSVRITKADTSIPIVIGWDGDVMDGWHRVAKAILAGERSIQAYRFEHYVPPDKVEE